MLDWLSCRDTLSALVAGNKRELDEVNSLAFFFHHAFVTSEIWREQSMPNIDPNGAAASQIEHNAQSVLRVYESVGSNAL